MPDELLGDRRKALEESFFRKENEKLRARLAVQQAERQAREDLAQASGISDEAVLDRLVKLGLSPETLAALSLVPLIEVAWANGKLDEKERKAVLSGAAASGVKDGSAACDLLKGWLVRKPAPALRETWDGYIRALVATLPDDARQALKKDLLDRARAVAEAAGGVLGLGSISKEEGAALERLERIFEG